MKARRLEGYTVFVDEYVKIRKEMGKDYLLPFQKKLEAAGVQVTDNGSLWRHPGDDGCEDCGKGRAPT